MNEKIIEIFEDFDKLIYNLAKNTNQSGYDWFQRDRAKIRGKITDLKESIRGYSESEQESRN